MKEQLKAKVYLQGLTMGEFLNRTGIKPASYKMKVSGEREFKRSEIESIAKVLRLTGKEVNEIFFPNLFTKN